MQGELEPLSAGTCTLKLGHRDQHFHFIIFALIPHIIFQKGSKGLKRSLGLPEQSTKVYSSASARDTSLATPYMATSTNRA